jgi:hypothetical protein
MALDEARLEAFVHRVTVDFGAALRASTIVVGEKLGLYRALAQIGPTDAATLAAATDCVTPLVEEWLESQFASGYCHFSRQTNAYWLSPEQASVLAEPMSPAYLVGGMSLAAANATDVDRICTAFRSGQHDAV